MTAIYKQYRLTSIEEPTDEMLHELMEEVARVARESSYNAEMEKKKRMHDVALQIAEWRNRVAV